MAVKSASGEFVRDGGARPLAAHDIKSSLASPFTPAVSAPSPSSLPLPTGLGAPVRQLSESSDSSEPPSASGPLIAPSLVTPQFTFGAQLPTSVSTLPGQAVLSPTLSRSSSSASVASSGTAAAPKKSTLNANAKVPLLFSIPHLFALLDLLVHQPIFLCVEVFIGGKSKRGIPNWWTKWKTVA